MRRTRHDSVALLRGINVGGRNKVPMAELRDLCAGLGWTDVRTYIQSGNVVFGAAGAPAEHEAVLEREIEGRFGLTISVVVRPAAAWAAYVKGNPFPEASARAPNHVMLCLAKAALRPEAAAALQGRAADGERVERVGEAIWIHFANGAGRSKLSPALMDRLVGSPVTARNWRTVLKLREMVGA